MERITDGRYLNLVPSSMQGGNTIADDQGVSMTGPGSPSVVPVDEYAKDVIPQPQIPAPHDAVFGPDHEPHMGHPAAGPEQSPGDGHGWHEVTEGGNGGWKQL